VIAYFDRARRQGDGGEAVVGGIARVLERVDSDVRVIAASIKSGDQAIAAVMAGAHAITAPIGVLEELAEHQLTRDAVAGFDEAVAGAGLPAGAPDRGV
jgi:transaldolase